MTDIYGYNRTATEQQAPSRDVFGYEGEPRTDVVKRRMTGEEARAAQAEREARQAAKVEPTIDFGRHMTGEFLEHLRDTIAGEADELRRVRAAMLGIESRRGSQECPLQTSEGRDRVDGSLPRRIPLAPARRRCKVALTLAIGAPTRAG